MCVRVFVFALERVEQCHPPKRPVLQFPLAYPRSPGSLAKKSRHGATCHWELGWVRIEGGVMQSPYKKQSSRHWVDLVDQERLD